MPNREFKLVIIKVLTTLEKRVEDLTELLKEIESIKNRGKELNKSHIHTYNK